MLHGLYLQTGTVYDFFTLWKENTMGYECKNTARNKGTECK